MKSLRLYYLIATTLLVIYLVAEYNKPLPINWIPTLSYYDKIPYGTYIAYKQIPDIFHGAELKDANESFYDHFHGQTDSGSNSNYIIISKAVKFSKYDFKELVNYIKAGNSVFIAAFEWSDKLADTLKIQVNNPLNSVVTAINFTNGKLKQAKDYKFDNGIANEYFNSFDTAKAVVLGKNEAGKSNLLCYKFGKGSLYLCADPQLFTNYSLLNKQGADYAAKAWSYMPVQPVVYWDHYQNDDIATEDSPMRVFFSHGSLQWAYYIALFSLLIFVFYEMKRRQRIIPIIEPLQNSTVDFVTVVGQVYYEQRNNLNIAQKKTLYFLEHLRTQYYLKTTPLDEDFIERFAQKTGIDLAFAHELINHIKYVNVKNRVTDNELIYLNHLIQQFYTKSS